MPKLHELQERRAKAVSEMRILADKVETRGDDYTADEDKRHSTLKTEIADLDAKIVRAKDVEEAERGAPAVISGNGRDGAFEDRARSFSLVRAINAQLGEGVDAAFEREISAEVRNRSGRKFNGIAVPDQYFHVPERRTLLAGSSAADLIPAQHRPDLFIDLLRSALVTGRLGATILDGLIGTQDIPRQTGSGTAQWVAEDGALTETDATLDDVNLAPKTVGSVTSFSRRAMINAVPSIEALVRRDLAAVVANAIDLQAMTGDGTGNTPVGIINTVDVANPTLATPSWAEVLTFISAIEGDDADVGTLGWALSPAAVKKLRSTNKVTAEPEHGFLMAEPGALAGFAAASTTALAPAGSPLAATVIFGAWSQLLIGYWSGLDVMLNPYESTAYHRGRVLVRAMRDVDVGVRHGESFAYASDLAI